MRISDFQALMGVLVISLPDQLPGKYDFSGRISGRLLHLYGLHCGDSCDIGE